ncbi:MAG: glycosyltransferase family 2 protein [Aquificae bacterium]|nr:glycosyltransferase family 2 protein [Aquificota bacterium]
MLYDVTASLVLYKNDPKDVIDAVKSFLDTKLKVLIYVVDNSPTPYLGSILEVLGDERIKYIFNDGKNLGFGKAHNIAIEKVIDKSKYHLILNPDVWFYRGTLEKLYKFMEENPYVGQVMPQVLYPNETIQALCKRLPSPIDLFGRRFLPKPLKKFLDDRLKKYECWDIGYDKTADIPALSGCFMFVRTEVFKEVGMFDDEYFMYMEDYDLCRRIGLKYETIYYPEVKIYHKYGKHSYKNKKLLLVHLKSAFRYFKKWGWILDPFRDVKNLTAGRV